MRKFLTNVMFLFSFTGSMLTYCGKEKQPVEAKRETVLEHIVHIEKGA